MNYKPIIIVAGEPNSIFFELFFKVVKKKMKSPIILIASQNLIKKQAKILKKKINFNITNEFEIIKKKNNLKRINLINVDFEQSSGFSKITPKSNHYITKCFDIAIKLLKNNVSNKFINGPISKKSFLKKKFLGITEFLAHKEKKQNKVAMLIYEKTLAVSPITTHLALKDVAKNLNKIKIINHVNLIHDFYKKKIKKTPKIAITGLNPHCESSYVSN